MDPTPEDWPEGKIIAQHYLAQYERVPKRLEAFVDDVDDGEPWRPPPGAAVMVLPPGVSFSGPCGPGEGPPP